MSDLRLKCSKIDFGWGFAPDPAGGTCSAPPDSLARIKGTYSNSILQREREGCREGKERMEEKQGEERERGKGEQGKEVDETPLPCVSLNFPYNSLCRCFRDLQERIFFIPIPSHSL